MKVRLNSPKVESPKDKYVTKNMKGDSVSAYVRM